KLARALAKLAEPKLEFRFINIGELPLYNDDLWQNPPDTVTAFKSAVKACQTLPDPRFLGALGKLVDEFALYRHLVRIATAIADDDDAHLATAIGDADSGQNIVHAARMRIILAQRTMDRAQLEGARPVLERLGDRRHLGKLEEVEVIT
ncbi:MAG: hypothetical protein ACLQUY_14975, partial [Ktedonobacterales bacterium]